ncbi:methyl-accepting chemotaxis protein [Dyella sp.]|jgi:methyl-accepting chemotaxis protein-2 (aspartate sensor receptor)|uniref:methyl-accepting chemotaxis protein n=1 Tax=Dyella sp. TaxID=1869338 RepID=UPI0039C86972
MLSVLVPLKSRIQSLALRFAAQLPERFVLDPRERVRVGEHDTPVLRNGTTVLNLNFGVPDRFTQQSGATATLFARKGDDFIRITTSVKKKDGGRAVGTLLDRSHPAWTELLAGQAFTGYATIFGTQFMTRYDPIADGGGQVIGARYVGLDVSAMRSVGMPLRVGLTTAVLNAAVWTALWLALPRAVTAAAMPLFAGLGAASSVGVAALVYLLVHRNISAPMSECKAAAGKIAAGDLSAQVPVARRDDIGQLLQAINGISVGLADVVMQVRHSSDDIHTATGQIAAGTADLSHRTQDQAASLEETAAAMEQLTATVRQNAAHAREADQLTASATLLAREGGEIVAQVVTTMGEIKASSRRIEDIAGMIDGIAFQTNILALNAAVEAARAGEHGRGFSVVASEVRGLAQRAAAAAREIKELIGSAVATVDAGTVLVDSAGDTTRRIAVAIERSAQLMSEISAASDEQSKGIEEVGSAVAQMDEATQSNAALVEESEAAARSLQEQAERMRAVVATFRTADQVARAGR